MSESEEWDSASYDDIFLQSKASKKKKELTTSKLYILHRILLVVKLVKDQRRFFLSKETNEHEVWRDLSEGRNLEQISLPVGFFGDTTCDSEGGCQRMYEDVAHSIMLFFSLNMNGIHARIYFVVGDTIESFLEHQFGSKVVESSRKYGGNVFSLDWNATFVDQTMVFGKAVRFHRLFCGVLGAVKTYFEKRREAGDCHSPALAFSSLARQPNSSSAFEKLDKTRLYAIPRTKAAMKIHPKLITESNCRFNETIYPKRPVVGKMMGENVYYRQNVQKLRTSGGWYRMGMEVVPGSKPYRILNKKRVYGPFQTRPLVVPTITGSTMEAFHPNMTPQDSVYLRSGKELCAEIGIKYAECLVNFSRRREPIFRGVYVPKRYAFVLNELLQERDHYQPILDYNRVYEATMKDWVVFLRKVRQYLKIREHIGIE